MKCFQCGRKDAVFSADCLVVEHKIDQGPYMRFETEQVKGVTRAGLCTQCMNVVSANCGDLIGPPALTNVAAVLFISGAAMFFLGNKIDAPMVTDKMNLIRLIGLVVGGISGLFLLVRSILAPTLLKRTPWKILGQRDGASLKLVPLGDGYYADQKRFNALNPYLGKSVSDKIYHEIIETGAWKDMIASKAKEA